MKSKSRTDGESLAELREKAAKFSSEIVETVRTRMAFHKAHPGKLVRFRKATIGAAKSDFYIGAVWGPGEAPKPCVWTWDTVNEWRERVSDEEVRAELDRRLTAWMAEE